MTVTAEQRDAECSREKRKVHLTVVTDSELGTWSSCHQLHDFKYRQKLRPLVAPKALAVGSIFHAGMRSGLKAGWHPAAVGLPVDERVRNQILAATTGIDGLVDAWAGKIVQHTKDVDYERLADEVEQTAKMVKWMLSHYFKQTKSDLTNLVLLEAEQPFSVPMRDRAGRVSPHVRYEGVRDAVFYDPTYNAIVLAEHKTTGGDPHAIERRVEMDTQSAGYIHALREEIAAGKHRERWPANVVPDGALTGRVMYNVLRKSLPEPPEVNKNGCVSVAQRATTVELYQAALDQQVNERKIAVTEKQREYLETLKGQGDRFFARVEYARTRAEIERWRLDAFAKARGIRAAEKDPEERDRNTGHCNMPWSLPCQFRQLCLDPDAPEIRAQFRVSESVHAEVRAAEAEVAV